MVAANPKAQKIKDYPKAIKFEQEAISSLQGGFEKIMRLNANEVKTKKTPLSGINETFGKDKEVTQKFTQLFLKLHSDQTRLAQITVNKNQLMGEVVQGCTTMKKSIQADS